MYLFILLQDCGHVMELEDMDTLMMGDQENIQIRQCPFCRKPIINTNRYKDIVNNMFKNEINPIKERIYGKNIQINEKINELKKKVTLIYNKSVEEHLGLITTIMQFVTFIKTQKKMYLLQVEMLIIYCNMLEMVVECWKAFRKTNKTTCKEELEEIIAMILQVMKIDPKSKVPFKISEQQQKDIGNEIKRLNAIVQLSKLLEVAKSVTNDSKIKSQIDAAETAVFTLSVFNEDKAIAPLEALQTTIKSSGIVAKLEREMIVKAVGFKAGHWYKCPNGHFYCIGNCGMANQVSKCADCGASIGGSGSVLISGNTRAPEMYT